MARRRVVAAEAGAWRGRMVHCVRCPQPSQRARGRACRPLPPSPAKPRRRRQLEYRSASSDSLRSTASATAVRLRGKPPRCEAVARGGRVGQVGRCCWGASSGSSSRKQVPAAHKHPTLAWPPPPCTQCKPHRAPPQLPSQLALEPCQQAAPPVEHSMVQRQAGAAKAPHIELLSPIGWRRRLCILALTALAALAVLLALLAAAGCRGGVAGAAQLAAGAGAFQALPLLEDRRRLRKLVAAGCKKVQGRQTFCHASGHPGTVIKPQQGGV